MEALDRYGHPLEDPKPRARYDEDGDLLAEFPPPIVEAESFPLVRYLLTQDLARDTFDWEPLGGCLWLRWDVARQVEERLRRFWPAFQATAAANPGYAYGQLAPQLIRGPR